MVGFTVDPTIWSDHQDIITPTKSNYPVHHTLVGGKWWLKEIKSTNRRKSHNRNFFLDFLMLSKYHHHPSPKSFTQRQRKAGILIVFCLQLSSSFIRKGDPSSTELVKFQERQLRNVNTESSPWLTLLGGGRRRKIWNTKNCGELLEKCRQKRWLLNIL